MKKFFGFLLVLVLLSGCNLLGQNSEKEVKESGNQNGLMEKANQGQEMDDVVNQGTGSQVGKRGAVWFQLQAAMSEKHPEWVIENYDIEITEDQGDYIKGLVNEKGPVAGGGYFYAAKNSEGKWVIASDGNGSVMCADIAPFDFPTNLIPECYDHGTGQMVQR